MSNQDNNQINLLKIIQWIVISISRNLRSLIILNLVVLLCGVGYKLYKPKVFEGRLIVKSNIIEYHFISEILSPLARHKQDFQEQSIAATLEIDQDLANSFSSYSINSLIDEEYVTKRKNISSLQLTEYEKDQVFELVIGSSEKENLPLLKDAILNYLRKQEYIEKRREFYYQENLAEKKRLEFDIQSMNKIKEDFAEYGFNLPDFDNDLLIENLGDFYFGSTRIYERLQKRSYETLFNDSFEEMSKFEVFEKHASPRWTPYLIGTALAGVIFSFIFIIAVEVRQSIKELPKD